MRYKHYNLLFSQYLDLKKIQKSMCAICKTKFGEVQLNVDHDHKTGKVRGLLCGLCNRRLGTLENWLFVQEAIDYLKNPPISMLLKEGTENK